MAEMAKLNKQLLASNQPGEHCPLDHHHDPPPTRELYTPAGMKQFVKTALGSEGREVSDLDLLNVLTALGLDY